MQKPTKSMSGNKPGPYFRKKNFWKYNLPSIFWAAFVLWLSLSPQKGLPHIPIAHFDKAVHFAFYFLLAAFLYYGWMKQQTFPFLQQSSTIKILLVSSLYGLGIEFCQELLTEDRHFSWTDEAVNVLGAMSGLMISKKFLCQ